MKAAEIKAKDWLDAKAALHNPNQIVGGFAECVTGVGDFGVNSFIGTQWKTRIDVVDEVIDEITRTTPYDKFSNIYLNVKLKGTSKNE
ncbi:hypothetical protein KG090_04345 [Carnobacteriaceae bacterium zg-ZUI240]|nr:hypothetical protein [Carnobacteriaceae bacterium zg-ZUI240]